MKTIYFYFFIFNFSETNAAVAGIILSGVDVVKITVSTESRGNGFFERQSAAARTAKSEESPPSEKRRFSTPVFIFIRARDAGGNCDNSSLEISRGGI